MIRQSVLHSIYQFTYLLYAMFTMTTKAERNRTVPSCLTPSSVFFNTVQPLNALLCPRP